MAKFTKRAIMYGFLKILKEKSLDKVTVKDICEFCEINRNTFYYYFQDIYDVLDSIFKEERENILKEIKEDTSFLDDYRRSAAIIINNKEAVKNIYNSKRKDILEDYLETVVKDFVKRSVIKACKKYTISDEDINYIICFYSYAITGNTMRWIGKNMPPYKENLLVRMSKSFDMTIDNMIKSCIENQTD